MRVWRLIWQLARYRFYLYLLSGLFASTMFYLFPLIPGLIVRWLFDTLTNAGPAGWNEWSLMALLLGTTVVRAAASFGSSSRRSPSATRASSFFPSCASPATT